MAEARDEHDAGARDADATVTDEDPPADDSFLMGVSGVEEEVLAEAARAEAQLQAGEEPEGGNDGAVV